MDVVKRLGYALKCIAVLFRMHTLRLNTSHAIAPLFSIRTLNRLGVRI